MNEFERIEQEIEARANVVSEADQIEINEIEKRARWMARRCGKITASIVPNLMTKGKGTEWGKTAITELLSIFYEQRTGLQRENFTTFAMRWGLKNEYPAFCYYRDHFNPDAVYSCEGDEIIFLEPIPGFGISPDAVTGSVGITEIKCPENPVNHLKYCMIERIEKGDDYFYQMIAQFLSGCEWIDFVSFDPRMDDDDPLKMHVVRLNRADYLADIVAVEARIVEATKLVRDWNLLKSL
jgi:hypothetical protein